MRTTIENMIALHYPETGLVYAQIINTIANSDTRNDLRELLKRLTENTDAHDFFDWGFFSPYNFCLKQRMGYKAPKVFNKNILIINFL